MDPGIDPTKRSSAHPYSPSCFEVTGWGAMFLLRMPAYRIRLGCAGSGKIRRSANSYKQDWRVIDKAVIRLVIRANLAKFSLWHVPKRESGRGSLVS